jgi:hypothetical protein
MSKNHGGNRKGGSNRIKVNQSGLEIFFEFHACGLIRPNPSEYTQTGKEWPQKGAKGTKKEEEDLEMRMFLNSLGRCSHWAMDISQGVVSAAKCTRGSRHAASW